MTRARFKILRHFLAGRRNGTSWADIAAFFFDGSYARKARGFIERTEDTGDFLATYRHPEHARRIADIFTRSQPRYRIRTLGIHQETGAPAMLHAWCE